MDSRKELEIEYWGRFDAIRERYASELHDLEMEARQWEMEEEYRRDLDRQHEESHWEILLNRAEEE